MGALVVVVVVGFDVVVADEVGRAVVAEVVTEVDGGGVMVVAVVLVGTVSVVVAVDAVDSVVVAVVAVVPGVSVGAV